MNNILDRTGSDYDAENAKNLPGIEEIMEAQIAAQTASIKISCCNIVSQTSENYCQKLDFCFNPDEGIDYCSGCII